jgi:hypothetical protein
MKAKKASHILGQIFTGDFVPTGPTEKELTAGWRKATIIEFLKGVEIGLKAEGGLAVRASKFGIGRRYNVRIFEEGFQLLRSFDFWAWWLLNG